MAIDEPEYSPLGFSGSRQIRIGSNYIERLFVAGHAASDLLRELVQNEFEGGGDFSALEAGRAGDT